MDKKNHLTSFANYEALLASACTYLLAIKPKAFINISFYKDANYEQHIRTAILDKSFIKSSIDDLSNQLREALSTVDSPYVKVFCVRENAPVKPSDNQPWWKNYSGSFDIYLIRNSHHIKTFFPGLTIYKKERLFDIKFIPQSQDVFPHLPVFNSVTLIEERIKAIARQAIHAPSTIIQAFQIITEEEVRAIFEDWNNTETNYTDTVIHRLIEAQAEKTPDAEAVIFQGKSISYAELNEKANQIARSLQRQDINQGSIVAICSERCIEMVIAALGILKSGAAYLPIDSEIPNKRIESILKDSRAKLVVVQESSYKRFIQSITSNRNLFQTKVTVFSKLLELSAAESEKNLIISASPNEPSYIIYTSGSTGAPKGVVSTHRGTVNRLLWMQEAFNIDAKDVVLQRTSISFDVSIWELFLPLISGARLVLAASEIQNDAQGLIEVIRSHQITVAHFVPSMLEAFLNAVKYGSVDSLRLVISSAEALPIKIQAHFHKKIKAKLYNLYGPTEASIYASWWECSNLHPADVVPIGKPIANTKLYILDHQLKPSPLGWAGDLYIGGVGLAKEYLNSPGLTQEKFIQNPFDPSERLYKTGDLARWLPDGNVDFLGRGDTQVKIQGNRIELGEIESCISVYPAVSQCVVDIKKTVKGERYLVAYVVEKEGLLKISDLRNHLLELLPNYMLPKAFVKLGKIPITISGKVDRKALPFPSLNDLPRFNELPFVAPSSPEEQALAEILAEILCLPAKISVRHNFFDLSGNSLHAAQMIARINALFSVHLTIRDIFDAPTITELLNLIHAKRHESSSVFIPSLKKTERSKPLPLSFAQQRIWFLQQLAPDNPFYNTSTVLSIKGELNITALERAFNDVINRHESLRTYFLAVNNIPKQMIIPAEDIHFKLVSQDVSSLEKKLVDHLIQAEVQKPFDLKRGPLLRAQLFKCRTNHHILLLCIHHIIIDGWSQGILQSELAQSYQTHMNREFNDFETLKFQYADFAASQQEWMDNDFLHGQLDYWHKQLQDFPVLEFPTDYPRPATPTYKGSQVSFTLSKHIIDNLKRLSQEADTTIFTTIFAAFSVLLFRYTGQEDILIGTPIAGRHYSSDLEKIVGFFVNSLALRCDLTNNPKFSRLLQRAKETALTAYANQDVPFEKIVESLLSHRNQTNNPIFQVMLSLEPTEGDVIAFPGLEVSVEEIDYGCSKFDLMMLLQPMPEGMKGVVEYSTDLFKRSTIQRFIEHFKILLNAIIENPHERISSLPILTEEESDLFLSWNNTDLSYSKDATLKDLFETKASAVPDQTAITYENEIVTYRQLNSKANYLAHHLMDPADTSQFVCVYTDRGISFGIATLSVIKANKAYIPIDSAYPASHVAYIIEHSQSSVLITQAHHYEQIKGVVPQHIRIIYIEDIINSHEMDRFGNLPTTGTSSDLAYVIYTSGSTGKPKGVVIEQKSLINCMATIQEYCQVNEKDVFLSVASVAFDASVLDFWLSLCIGAKLIIANQTTRTDGNELSRQIREHDVTVLQATPSTAKLLAVSNWPGKSDLSLMLSGEPLSDSLAAALHEKCKVYNLYGLTETTVYTTYVRVDEQPVSIGRPIGNTKIYIADKFQKLVPIGVPGEIYVESDGLLHEYLRDPELTAKKIIKNPFSHTNRAQVFRTGDFAKWLENGNIEYLHRKDNQLKIRGHMIEPKEVEAALEAFPEFTINQAIVKAAGPTRDNSRIVAYIQVKNDHSLHSLDLSSQYVENRQSLFEAVFEQAADIESSLADPQFNIFGWNSSYTGKPLAAGEMHEWVESTVDCIKDLKPKSILEVGSGTGLLMFKLAPLTDFYHATDFSEKSVKYLQNTFAKANLDQKKVKISQGFADKVIDTSQKKYDTVVVNSVVQYFPSRQYLESVLENLLSHINEEGQIFLGDLRNFDLLEHFHASVARHKLPKGYTYRDWSALTKRNLTKESELLISPRFFYEFAKKHPQISHVHIELKPGDYDNEMNHYRYNVVLSVRQNTVYTQPDLECQWNANNPWSLGDIRSMLTHNKPSHVRLKSIPNARLGEVTAALSSRATSNQDDMVPSSLHSANSGLYPQDLWKLGEACNTHPVIRWSSHDATLIDVEFLSKDKFPSKLHTSIDALETVKESIQSPATNEPLDAYFLYMLAPKIKSYLQDKLPEYMIPSQFILAHDIPMTSNGKVDFDALPAPEMNNISDHNYEPPRTSIEKQLIEIWRNLLRIEEIGRQDNFFELGGHSLLAVELIAQIEKTFSITIGIRTLFEAPTVERLAEKVQNSLHNYLTQTFTGPYLSTSKSSPVVQLKDGADCEPVFLIHPAGGTLFSFTELVKQLKTDHPIYGIQDPGLYSGKTLFSSIEEMATYYIEAIQEMQPYGPYQFIGSSFGGTVAVEMAQQLSDALEETSFVGLIDSWANHSERSLDRRALEINMIKQHKELFSTLLKPFSSQQQWLDFIWQRMELLLKYKVPKIEHPLVLYKAQDVDQDQPPQLYNYWDLYAKDNLRRYLISGDHDSMLKEPNVTSLARAIEESLSLFVTVE